jgi:hypothetical protein
MQTQHRLGAGEPEGIAGAPGEELDPGIGLALVLLEAEGEASVRGPGPGLLFRNRYTREGGTAPEGSKQGEPGQEEAGADGSRISCHWQT